jgi:F-type H+-transporting ATPase subunit gamma
VHRPAVAQQTANYATLKEIEGRLKSIKNIEKITKTMKIVASTKLTRAQKAMNESRVYGKTSNEVFEKAETKPLEGEGKKALLVVCSSDKGLCGGVHSGMSRYARRLLAEHPNVDIVVAGEKCKAQLSRSNPQNFVLSFAGVGKDVPTFADASAIADQIMLLPTEYSSIQILYNKFINAQSYEPTLIDAFSTEAIIGSANYTAYEVEDEDLGNLSEYALANSLYWALAEGHAVEQSARRNAMDVSVHNSDQPHKQSKLTTRPERLKERWRHDQQVHHPVQPNTSSRHHGRTGRDYHRCHRLGGHVKLRDERREEKMKNLAFPLYVEQSGEHAFHLIGGRST